MAEQEPKRATSPVLVLAGVALAAVAVIAAFLADPEYGWPLLILIVILLVATLGYRLITSSAGGGDADSTSNVPQQQPRGERPLGDTPEAHDELNPHDLPLDNPGRDEAEEMAGGSDGTTRGPLG